MLEMLKSRKEQLQAQGKKGFTLMEMLIVIAIIAILIAIAIPVFTAQLNNARLATDEANIRSGYATATAKVLTENISADTELGTLQKDASLAASGSNNYVTQGTDGSASIGGQDKTWTSNQTVSYSYVASTNKVVITIS